MSETQMWVYLRNHAPKNLFTQRITDRLIKGIPDVHWAVGKESGWFEMKYARKLDQKLDIRADQVSWVVQYPGRAGVLVRVHRDLWYYFPKPQRDVVLWASTMQGKNWFTLKPRVVWDEGFTVKKLVVALMES